MVRDIQEVSSSPAEAHDDQLEDVPVVERLTALSFERT